MRKANTPTRLDGEWIARLDPAVLDRVIEAAGGTPVYVYSAPVLRARVRELVEAFPRASIRYAMKANANPAVLDLLRREGIGVDTVSPYEIRLAREVGFRRRDIAYSGNNPSNDELRLIHRRGIHPSLDALSALDRFGRIAPGAKVSLRLNLDIGAGHHPHVITAGPDSKFGLAADDLPEARRICATHGLRIAGLHQHIGSGLFDSEPYLTAADRLFDLAATFDSLERVDIGGGFGVPYRHDEKPVDLRAWGKAIGERFARLEKRARHSLELLIEPGRYIVAEAGALVATVTTVKHTRDRVFVGVDSGMHHLVRPAMYGSHHPVHLLATERPDSVRDATRCFFVGPICESGDVLAEERTMVPPREGDRIAIGVAGAYGFAMASQYNLRARPSEVLIDGDDVRLVRKRERYRDVVRKRDL